MDIQIRRAGLADIAAARGIIDERICWMTANGIRQWNTTIYTMHYNYGYFLAEAKAGRLYVADCGGTITAVFVLLTKDKRWPEDEPAYYIHNFAVGCGYGGIGRDVLLFCEAQAKADGKKYLRLDCATDNIKLNKYYDIYGFEPAGYVDEGHYKGIRRQKQIV